MLNLREKRANRSDEAKESVKTPQQILAQIH